MYISSIKIQVYYIAQDWRHSRRAVRYDGFTLRKKIRDSDDRRTDETPRVRDHTRTHVCYWLLSSPISHTWSQVEPNKQTCSFCQVCTMGFFVLISLLCDLPVSQCSHPLGTETLIWDDSPLAGGFMFFSSFLNSFYQLFFPFCLCNCDDHLSSWSFNNCQPIKDSYFNYRI